MGLVRQYSCPTCGMKYPHDKGYIHSISECQKTERKLSTNKMKGR